MSNRIDTFRRATGATMRAMAGLREIAVEFSRGPARLLDATVHLPLPSKGLEYPEVARIRGAADTIALRFRHHDPTLHGVHAPAEETARALFDLMEEARYEALGAQRMAGVAGNLGAVLEERCDALGVAEVCARDDATLPEALRLFVREAMTQAPPPQSASRLVDLWRPYLGHKTGTLPAELTRTMHDQRAFAAVAKQVLTKLGFTADPGPDQQEYPQDTSQRNDKPEHCTGDDMSKPSATVPHPQEDVDASIPEDDSEGINDEFDIAREYLERELAAAQNEESRSSPGAHGSADSQVYRAYVTDFDEVVDAADLCPGAEMHQLRVCLDEQLTHLHGLIARLANRLQRRLLARQARRWAFDLESGVLDAGRLARIVANPAYPLSYKREEETDFRDTVVSLLIDNSGSMRGRPITIAAISADILARTLERCGVKTEILGFTTRAWKGGASRERWLNEGKRPRPGRLNDLRHIIYKSADTPWRRARKNLGLMLREGILKENIDGEAVLWAHQRLSARPEQRRILMVISDGTPVDDATLSANASDYLERHLRQVIEHIEKRSPIELLAIGIGHDVTRFYRRAVTLDNAEQLGSTMMDKLAELFEKRL